MRRPRRIDAHQHYWRLDRGDCDWIPADGPLARDYLPSDLAPCNASAGIDGTIAVQAAPTVAETEWLLELAAGEPSILGVVGWAPLEDPADDALERFAEDPRCVGVRPMLQDLPDAAVAAAIPPADLARVAAGGLVFDLLVRARQLPLLPPALEAVPELVVVVDHLAKPDYREAPGAWAGALHALAARPGTFCKLSGLVSEVGPGWKPSDFAAHAQQALDAFGPWRVMFGSDWPVCLAEASHAEVYALARWLTSRLTDEEQAAVFGGNAERIYGV